MKTRVMLSRNEAGPLIGGGGECVSVPQPNRSCSSALRELRHLQSDRGSTVNTVRRPFYELYMNVYLDSVRGAVLSLTLGERIYTTLFSAERTKQSVVRVAVVNLSNSRRSRSTRCLTKRESLACNKDKTNIKIMELGKTKGRPNTPHISLRRNFPNHLRFR